MPRKITVTIQDADGGKMEVTPEFPDSLLEIIDRQAE